MLEARAMESPNVYKNRRRRPRVFMGLPIEVREMGGSEVHGAIVMDGSELGFLICSIKDMPIGTKLNIFVLFHSGMQLTNLEVSTEIVRKVKRKG
jgi:hypothetical protein